MNAQNVESGTELRDLYRALIAIHAAPDYWLDDRLTAERRELCQRIHEIKYAPAPPAPSSRADRA